MTDHPDIREDDQSEPATPGSAYYLKIALAVLAVLLLAAVPVVLTWGDSDEPPSKPSPTLSPVAAPPGEPITVTEFGQTAFEREPHGMISLGAVFTNSSDAAAFNTQITITAYDAAGEPLSDGTWTQSISQIPAGGKAYMAGVVTDLERPWKITAATDLRLTIGESFWRRDTNPRPAPEPSDVTVTPGENPYATVEFRAPVDLDMKHTPVWVLFRDSAGTIVGGCTGPAFGPEPIGDGRHRLKDCTRPDTTDGAPEVHIDYPDRFATPSPEAS